MSLFFVTGNKHKFAEVSALIPGIQQLDIDLPEIQSLDPKEIITAKLTEARQHHHQAIAVEDVSLSLEGLHGLPGPMIKWFLQAMGARGIYELTQKIGNDRATISCTVGLSQPTKKIVLFTTHKSGRIVAPRVNSEFGWNPIFQQEGLEKTYAEMTVKERNTISHRAEAWNQVKGFLKTHK